MLVGPVVAVVESEVTELPELFESVTSRVGVPEKPVYSTIAIVSTLAVVCEYVTLVSVPSDTLYQI